MVIRQSGARFGRQALNSRFARCFDNVATNPKQVSDAMTAVPPSLQHRPAIHQLCTGAFIQEPLHLASNVSAFPLKPLGFSGQAVYAALYSKEIAGAIVDGPALESLKQQCASALPVIALAVRHAIDAAPEDLERVAAPLLTRARSVVSWVAGQPLQPFAFVTLTLRGASFRLVTPQGRRRQRLGFGNTGPQYQAQLGRILRCAEDDERFAFALSLFDDSLREENAEFRVARQFACLEALAYRVKAGRGSRQAVRYLLGLERGALATIAVDGAQYRYDRVEIGGRIRDKLFHGAPFDPDELTEDARAAYDYLLKHPEQLGDLLLIDCELEIARWANNASRGQQDPPATLVDKDKLVAQIERMVTEANGRLADAAILSGDSSKRADSDYLLQLLAFEILLKALVRIYQRPTHRNHSYVQLFKLLPLQVRSRVIETAKARMSGSADYSSVPMLLNTFGRNFIALRYPYEEYEDFTADAYAALGKEWAQKDAPLEEATFVYYPEELSGLVFALQAEIRGWLDAGGGKGHSAGDGPGVC